MRILLVDDDTSVLQSLLAVLKTLPGHEVKVATSGGKALENAAAMGGIDLLITDVVMEPMDGFTLCTQMMERFPGVRTIFVSGYDLSAYGESLQHYQLLQKPVAAESLIAAVQKELAPAAPAAAARPVAVASATPQATATATATPRARVTAVGTSPSPQVAVAQPAVAGNTAVAEPDTASTEMDSSGLLGQMIGGYQIVTQLGEGRWGTVYAAVQTSINRPVGLKVLDPVRARDKDQQERFIADARAKANVQHPSILAVYEAGSANGWIFYTHEYVDGHNLAEYAQAGRKFEEPVLLKILRVVAEGFIYLSRTNVPHAPVEAGDIYLSVDGQPRLSNLAMSRVEQLPTAEQEIQALGRAMLPLAPAQGLSQGLQALLHRMAQGGQHGINAWGALLQAVKALEPKIVPLEAAKISAQDRAAVAAVEAARLQQKRSFYLNVGSMLSLILVTAFLIWWKFVRSNERNLDAQIEIPAGEFMFGPNAQQLSAERFWIDKFEVTIGQYAKFVDFIEKHPEREKDYDHPQQPPSVQTHIPKDWDKYYGRAKAGLPVRSIPTSLNAPANMVTWWDAYAYAKWRGRELPTEQEWEKAARGTRGFQYPWGETATEKNANTGADHNPNNPAAKGSVDGFNFWNDVDDEKTDKSTFGVMGMAGNVSEWTGSWMPDKRFPIIKGGNYSMPLKPLSDHIGNHDPSVGEEFIGFRTVTHTPPTGQ